MIQMEHCKGETLRDYLDIRIIKLIEKTFVIFLNNY